MMGLSIKLLVTEELSDCSGSQAETPVKDQSSERQHEPGVTSQQRRGTCAATWPAVCVFEWLRGDSG